MIGLIVSLMYRRAQGVAKDGVEGTAHGQLP
jgi:hypothetical protein